MRRIFSLICISCLTIPSIVLGNCALDVNPPPVLESYKKNIDFLSAEIRKLAEGSSCIRPSSSPSYLDVTIPIERAYSLLGVMRSRGYTIESLLSETSYYFRGFTAVLPSIQRHQKYLLDMLGDIQKLALFVGTRCANGIQFDEDLKIPESDYATRNKTLQEVIVDMHEQSSEVLYFFRNLSRNIADEKYTDSTFFLIAPRGFADEMRKFYTATALQACHQSQPNNESIKDVIKKAVSVSWKYPQALQVWREAWDLLLYRGAQIFDDAKPDAQKEAQIDSLVRAQRGGIGNSRALINAQFVKEFFQGSKNKTFEETVKDYSLRLAREIFGDQFIRETATNIARESRQDQISTLVRYAQYEKSAQDLVSLDRALYDDYARHNIHVGRNSGQDPITVTGLVQALDSVDAMRADVQKNLEIACKNLSKQATNIGHPECRDFMGD